MSYIPEGLRQLVHDRAGGCCEYCLLHEDDNLFAHEIDHIRAVKHRGTTEANNLAFSCFDCNRNKGSDLGSIDDVTDALVPLFNPRQQQWADHFQLSGVMIEPLTPEGRITVLLLDLNNMNQVKKRLALVSQDRYPCIFPEND
ncbi:MAG: HNH endonuclease [Anaerolineae bacterium]|nr:HNH endonuclease [Anaerolineae bacterium]